MTWACRASAAHSAARSAGCVAWSAGEPVSRGQEGYEFAQVSYLFPYASPYDRHPPLVLLRSSPLLPNGSKADRSLGERAGPRAARAEQEGGGLS